MSRNLINNFKNGVFSQLQYSFPENWVHLGYNIHDFVKIFKKYGSLLDYLSEGVKHALSVQSHALKISSYADKQR